MAPNGSTCSKGFCPTALSAHSEINAQNIDDDGDGDDDDGGGGDDDDDDDDDDER